MLHLRLAENCEKMLRNFLIPLRSKKGILKNLTVSSIEICQLRVIHPPAPDGQLIPNATGEHPFGLVILGLVTTNQDCRGCQSILDCGCRTISRNGLLTANFLRNDNESNPSQVNKECQAAKVLLALSILDLITKVH